MKNAFRALLLLGLSLFPSLLQADPALESGDSYQLRPNDVFEFLVHQDPELTCDVTVLKTGQASFPLIGSFETAGLTLDETSEEVRKRFAAKYIRKPTVDLTIKSFAKEEIFVIGFVKESGVITLPLSGYMNVVTALNTAGGITGEADPENIQLINAAGEATILSQKKIQSDGGQIKMKAGDRLIVNQNPFLGATVGVLGFVKSPNFYQVSKESGNVTLKAALATAGGPATGADLLEIDVTVGGVIRSYSYAAIQSGRAGQLTLKGGDSVVVSQSPFFNKTVTILGQVNKRGAVAFPLDGRFDLMKAIAMAGGFTELADLKKVSVSRGPNKSTYDVRKMGQGTPSLLLQPNDIIYVDERWW